MTEKTTTPIIVTAGATYLDIDAYACMVAMAELRNIQGFSAIAYSNAPCNYSVCPSLFGEGQMATYLPENSENTAFIIVDVSDPNYLSQSVPLDRVTEVYDHHVGFEDYWRNRIGDNARIEFIGAAATLIYREWKKSGLLPKMKPATAKLLAAAILDNTLNLTSNNKTAEDMEAYCGLCGYADIRDDFRGMYFSEVQKSVEADLKNALLGDVKRIQENPVLPAYMGQVALWNVAGVLERMEEIHRWFGSRYESWMLNVIDIQHNCNYFVCNHREYQRKIEQVFDVCFDAGVAKTSVSYLRKEIIKKCILGLTFN